MERINVLNLDEYKSIGTHWIALYVNGNNGSATYSDRFGVEHIPKEIKKLRKKIFLKYKYRKVLCGLFCIRFIDFMFKGKSLLDYTNLFSSK